MELGIIDYLFTLNGQFTFLLGLSYYGGQAASEETIRADLDRAQANHVNWIRVWANWAGFDYNTSAVDHATGEGREPYLERLKWLVAECDRRGMVVDVTLSRGNGVTGPPRLQSHAAHLRAVESLVTHLMPWRNWYFDLSNERDIQDERFTSYDELAALRRRVAELDPARLVTASHAKEFSRDDLQAYLFQVGVDFLSPHRPRYTGTAQDTQAWTREVKGWMRESGRSIPLHYQEPFRRGFGKWQPEAEDFLADLRGARVGGAAGWCFHNGDQRAAPDGRPRRSFDLRDGALFDQFDPVEHEVLRLIREFDTA